jgi:hypothetical protein
MTRNLESNVTTFTVSPQPWISRVFFFFLNSTVRKENYKLVHLFFLIKNNYFIILQVTELYSLSNYFLLLYQFATFYSHAIFRKTLLCQITNAYICLLTFKHTSKLGYLAWQEMRVAIPARCSSPDLAEFVLQILLIRVL